MNLQVKTMRAFGLVGMAALFIASSFGDMSSAVPLTPMIQGQNPSGLLSETSAEQNRAAPVQFEARQIPQEKSMQDHKAVVSKIAGDVKILRKHSETWTNLTEGSEIRIGDQIRTGQNSYAEIFYDDFYLNMARIAENTFAEFQAIEPTRIHIMSGSIYNILDGLPKHSSYMVSTPTSVAGVRGTRFLRAFDAAAKTDGTFVSHGSVDVESAETYGKPGPGNLIRVTGGSGLVLDTTQTAAMRMDQAAPQPLRGDQLDRLNDMTLEVKKHLTEFVGYRETQRAEARWQEIGKNSVLRPVRTQLDAESAAGSLEKKITPDRFLAEARDKNRAPGKPGSETQSGIGTDRFTIVVPVKKLES